MPRLTQDGLTLAYFFSSRGKACDTGYNRAGTRAGDPHAATGFRPAAVALSQRTL